MLYKMLILLLIIVMVVIGGAAGLLWSTLPPGSGSLRIAGLSAPVNITIDGDGVPRISAANDTDAATALGYLHARDRMFQMELMRRAASGRLSELAGPATLALDRMMRTLGLRRAAAADLPTLPADTRAMLEAYARGVNAWIDQRGRRAAPEFLVLGAPAHWTPVDSLLWGEVMGLWLSANWRMELNRLALAGSVPAWMIRQLWPPQDENGNPEAAISAPQFAATADHLLALLPRFPAPYTSPGKASNAWAVDGAHSATGAPLLAGDPHLAFGFPAIWYLARIDTPDRTLAGATAPGVPFMVLGHNRDIAWTFTTTGADTQDIFIEKPVGANEYATPDGPRPFAVRHEVIKIRGKPDQLLTVRETRHGPVISDLDGGSGQVLAVSMASLKPGNQAAAGLYALNRARSVAEAGVAAAAITAPIQNLTVADQHHIGLFVTGRIPLRRAGDGSAPVRGDDGAHDWTGWASGAALPHYVDPPSGHLVNANERVAPPDFPVFMGQDWFGDWRARRIRELLSARPRAAAEDFVAMQLDTVSLFARDLLPTLTSLRTENADAEQALELLRHWDGDMAMALPQPLIFHAWIERFVELVLRDAGISRANAGPRAEFAAFVLSPHGRRWCGGDCAPLLRASLAAALADLRARLGPDPARWRWGEAHQAVFASPFLRAIPLVGWLTTQRIDTPGDGTTIDCGIPAPGSFNAVHGPEYRGVYDLADLDRSLFVVAPGQSGNPLSGHARDFLRRWRDGRMITLGREPGKVAGRIALLP
jgi:penicillin amidase